MNRPLSHSNSALKLIFVARAVIQTRQIYGLLFFENAILT
jgi:hypothetical protein